MSREIEPLEYSAVPDRTDSRTGANHWRELSITQKDRAQFKRPIQAPFDIDARRIDVKRSALAGGLFLGSLVVALLGGQIVLWSIEREPWLNLGSVFGSIVALAALAFGFMLISFVVVEWKDHRDMLYDLHNAYLNSLEATGGAETYEYTSEIELSTDNPAHVLIAALWVHMRQRQGTEQAYTVRNLYGPVFLAERRVGDISKLTAERMGTQFAQLGLVAGRGDRRAGQWVPQSADEILYLITKNWR